MSRLDASATLGIAMLTASGAVLAQPGGFALTCSEPNGYSYYLGGSPYPTGWHPDGMRGGTIALTSTGPGQFTVTARDAAGSAWLLAAAQSRILVDETRSSARTILVASTDPAIRSADTFLFRIADGGMGDLVWTFMSTGLGGAKATVLRAECRRS